MFQVIVDWWGRKFGKPLEFEVGVYDEPPPSDTPREIGVRFQREEFAQLLNTIGHWETIEFFTADRVPIESIDDLPMGADGGIDALVRITAPTEHGASVIAGRLRSILINQRYAAA